MALQPTEAKVKASSVAAGISAFALTVVQRYLFDGNQAPEFVSTLVVGTVTAAVAAVVTWGSGYSARHTPRADRYVRRADPVD